MAPCYRLPILSRCNTLSHGDHHGHRLRLSRYFGLNDDVWTGLQLDYDAAQAKDELRDVLARIKPLQAA